MEEINLKELAKFFISKISFVLAMTIIFFIGGFVYINYLLTPMYHSSTTLILVSDNTNENSNLVQSDINLNKNLVTTYSEIVKSKTVLAQVISNLQIADLTEEQLRKSVTVSAVEDTEVIKIIVSNQNPEYAAKIANEIGKVFSEKISDMYKINNVYTLDAAEPSSTPYNIKPAKYIFIAIVAGIFISCAIIIVMGLFDTTVKSAEEIEQALKIPVIAQLDLVDETVIRKGGRRKW